MYTFIYLCIYWSNLDCFPTCSVSKFFQWCQYINSIYSLLLLIVTLPVSKCFETWNPATRSRVTTEAIFSARRTRTANASRAKSEGGGTNCHPYLEALSLEYLFLINLYIGERQVRSRRRRRGVIVASESRTTAWGTRKSVWSELKSTARVIN